MTDIYQRQIINDESVLKSLGKITLAYSFLEELVTDCIIILLDSDGAHIITTGLSFSRSLAILKALYLKKYPGDRDKEIHLSNLVNRSEQAHQKRNQLIHSFWRRDETTGTLLRIKHQVNKRGFSTDSEQIDINELSLVADEIEDIASVVQEFMDSLLAKYTTYQISPADQAVAFESPVFQWTRVENALSYEIQVARDPTFMNLLIDATGNESVQETTYQSPIPFEPFKVYYWRVRPVLSNAIGYWSAITTFDLKQRRQPR